MAKTFLIIGGSGGIGSAVARALAIRGDNVAIVARDAARLGALASEIGAKAFPGDVLDAAALGEIAERVESEVGEIDGLVNAVGSIVLRPLHALSLEEWRATLEINATSAFIALKTIAPRMMRRRRGSVVMFSSVAATTGMTNHEAIGAAKSAVEGLVRSASISYARYGMRINAVAPALTRTPLSNALWSNETSLAASTALHPLGRIGDPSDITAAVLYFLDDGSTWTTGQILGVDGGLGVGSAPPKIKVG